MRDAPLVAVAEQRQQLPRHTSCCSFLEISLSLQHISKRFAVLVLHDHKEAVIVFEELVDLWHCRVVDLLQLAYLLLKQFALMTSNFVFVDDVNCSHKACLGVNDLPQLVKLVLLQARRKYLIFGFNAAFDLSNEVLLFKFNLSFAVNNFYSGLIG